MTVMSSKLAEFSNDQNKKNTNSCQWVFPRLMLGRFLKKIDKEEIKVVGCINLL